MMDHLYQLELKVCRFCESNLGYKITRDICDVPIHSKSGISWMEKSADDLEFSAEGLSGNAKTFKFALL